MSKSVLMSIQPYWVFLIIAKAMGWNISKEKTVEVRKSYPKSESWNKVVKIYCSKDKKSFAKIPKEYQPFMKQLLGKVIGEFIGDAAFPISISHSDPDSKRTLREFPFTGMTEKEIMDYLGNGKTGCGWYISNLKIYDEPKELRDYCKVGVCPCSAKPILHCTKDMSFCANRNITRPPQSWCYVEEV